MSQTKNEVVFAVLEKLFDNSLNVQCIHDISLLLRIFDENTKYEKLI